MKPVSTQTLESRLDVDAATHGPFAALCVEQALRTSAAALRIPLREPVATEFWSDDEGRHVRAYAFIDRPDPVTTAWTAAARGRFTLTLEDPDA